MSSSKKKAKPKLKWRGIKPAVWGLDMRMLANFRSMWLFGRYGGGKTLTAFALASRLVVEGYADRIVSNIPAKICSNMPTIEEMEDLTQKLNLVLVLDEGGLFAESWRDAKGYMAALRKWNVTVLLPSVMPVNTRLRLLTNTRLFDGYTFGLPVWFYRLKISADPPDVINWALVNPGAFFGAYSTRAMPLSDGGWAKRVSARMIKEKEALGEGELEEENPDPAQEIQASQDELAQSMGSLADRLGGLIRGLKR